ncbi:MAG: GNAT family N-acetyltransferase [Streptosporangiaceae bacterium]
MGIEPGVLVTGLRYLELATTLLQRMRLAEPAGGIWEGADVQWWWRRERSTDHDGQLFWLDQHGEPRAAAIRTDFGRSVQCDVLVLDPDYARTAWRAAIGRAPDGATEFPVEEGDATGLAELAAAGFEPGQPAVVGCWLEAPDRPAIPELAPGYRLLSRADALPSRADALPSRSDGLPSRADAVPSRGDAPDRPHPLADRNGVRVEQRLRQCSLYRPELDLMVAAPDGQVAGYGLFWADPVTGVGLVEPMRTEQAHQRRGIAGHILAAGLDRLAAHGCRRLKVSNDIGLYLRAGFRPVSSAPVLSRPAA